MAGAFIGMIQANETCMSFPQVILTEGRDCRESETKTKLDGLSRCSLLDLSTVDLVEDVQRLRLVEIR